MRNILTKLHQERGQMIIFLMGIFTVMILISAIVVDFGLWFSERRGAVKDADATSLAGVQAYLGDLADTGGAWDDAVDWAVKNGVNLAEIDAGPATDCSAGNSCIQVGIGNCREDGTDTSMPWVEAKIRHNSRSLFSSIFGIAAPDIGGIARACVGSPRSAIDLNPLSAQTGFVTDPDDPNFGEPLSDCFEPDPDDPTQTRPIYGAVCILKTGAGECVTGQCGQLTIGTTDCDQTSANTLKHDFHYGAGAQCTLGQEVQTGTGNIIGLLQGLNDRLEEELVDNEDHCDDLFFTGNPVYDDFDEVFSLVGAAPGTPVVPSADNVFSENDCKVTRDDGQHIHTFQPRAVDLVLIDRLEPNAGTATITGFAAFYIIGCVDDDVAEETKQAIEQDLTASGSLAGHLNRCERPTGQDDILGIFVQTLAPPVNVGDPDPNLPLAIVLVK